MSYSEMMVVLADGNVESLAEMSNGHGSAPCVWTALCRKYESMMYPNRGFLDRAPMVMDQWEDLWKVVAGKMPGVKPLPLHWWEWNVLQWTYDNAMVKRADFEVLARSFRMFQEALVLPIHVCHLGQIATEIDGILADTIDGAGPLALCHYHTSVSGHPWSVYNAEEDESTPYNINTGTKHWFVDVRGPEWVAPAEQEAPTATV